MTTARAVDLVGALPDEGTCLPELIVVTARYAGLILVFGAGGLYILPTPRGFRIQPRFLMLTSPLEAIVFTIGKYSSVKSMGPSKMDEKSAARIAKSRGKNDPFAKRAEMAARNNKDQKGEGSDRTRRKSDSGQKKGDGGQEK
ncbi:hypothetical protein M434DRAFT_28260 [Hypoxylon sp. CO27-5]|nr:hypothetical protein M434DRAFT_28260 [Hypoxylon sp. CO27-5]